MGVRAALFFNSWPYFILGVAHTYVAYSVFKGIFPGRESKYLKNSVRGPEFPLNASFVRDMHFEKERIDLKG